MTLAPEAPTKWAESGFDISRAAAKVPTANLPGDRPIVGCVGQINNTFDWGFIAELVVRASDFVFVFIGPLIEDDPAIEAANGREAENKSSVQLRRVDR